VATLYVTAQGTQVVAEGLRRRVDPHWFRGNSYFRIGWDWIKTALDPGWQLIHSVCFTFSGDPEPEERLLENNMTTVLTVLSSKYILTSINQYLRQKKGGLT
jgi:hypothetical protein